jgi:hypothetical protein
MASIHLLSDWLHPGCAASGALAMNAFTGIHRCIPSSLSPQFFFARASVLPNHNKERSLTTIGSFYEFLSLLAAQ